MQIQITVDVPRWFEGDPEEALRREVVKHVGDLVAARIAEEVQDQIVTQAMASAKEQVDQVVRELLTMPIQQTNSYGEPRGEAKTLRQAIIDQGVSWLSEAVDDRGNAGGYGRERSNTRARWYARQVATEAVDKELKDAIAAAVKEIRESVKVRAKDLLADAVAKILEQRG